MNGGTNSVVEYRDWGNDIPVDNLVIILSKLKSMENLERFAAVCPQWRLANAYYKDGAIQHTPWLIAKKLMESGVTVHLPLADIPFSIDIHIGDVMSGAFILCSKHEWLLMSKGTRVFFFNIFLKSIIKLPKLPKPSAKFSGFTFASSPTSKDCLVFGLSPHSYSKRKFCCVSVSIGDKDWKSRNYNHLRNDLYPCSSSPVYHGGKFYSVWSGGILVVFHHKLEPDTFSILGAERVATQVRKDNCLLEVDGELFMVFTTEMGRKVFVCKWDDSNQIWHKVDDLGEYMFFVNDRTTYAKKTTAPNMRNKIYFSYLDVMKGVFYCLESESFQSEHSLSTEAILDSCWMDHTSTLEWVEKCTNRFELGMNNDYDGDDGDEDDDTFTSVMGDEDDIDALYPVYVENVQVQVGADYDYDDDDDDDDDDDVYYDAVTGGGDDDGANDASCHNGKCDEVVSSPFSCPFDAVYACAAAALVWFPKIQLVQKFIFQLKSLSTPFTH